MDACDKDSKDSTSQDQLEQKQVQTNPEKKFYFQITSIKVQETDIKLKIQKQLLPQLIAQLLDMNNIPEEQLKQQEFLYFPINQFQTHWISIVIFLKQKVIFYFDSIYKKIEPIIIQGINSILDYLDFNPTEFETKPIYNQQSNQYDCGVFVLLSLLYTLQLKHQYNYNQQTADKYRQRILYNLAVIGSQIDVDQNLLENIIELG